MPLTTPADETDVALASMEFFAPFSAAVITVCMVVVGFRWLRSIGRYYG